MHVVGHELLDPLQLYGLQVAAVVPDATTEQVPVVHVPHASHAPLQQCPSAEQMADVHCVPVVQEPPLATNALHTPPAPHTSPDTQSIAVEHFVGQVLTDPPHVYGLQAAAVVPWLRTEQLPLAHVPQGPHAPPQQYPSAEQLPDVHWVPSVHMLPLPSGGTHLLLTQTWAGLQSLLCAHVLGQVWFVPSQA
jgi:hypothetical protein